MPKALGLSHLAPRSARGRRRGAFRAYYAWDNKGIICQYKVIISLIDKEMVDDFSRNNGITLVEGDEIGARWVSNLVALDQAVKAVGANKIITFHSRVPKSHKEDGYRLGQWVSVQRAQKDVKLSPERIKRLDEIGFVWDMLKQKWEEGFAALRQFKEREGHCRVRVLHKEGDFKLGTWSREQRKAIDTLSPESWQRLDKIGFVWDPRRRQWEEGFAALKHFMQREGHCRVPRAHKEGDYKLGTWVRVQRRNKDALSPERLRWLENIGFVWDARLPPTVDG